MPKQQNGKPRMRAVHMSDEMWTALRKQAFEEEVTISALVRRMIETQLQQQKGSK
jgi:hypothetical protein